MPAAAAATAAAADADADITARISALDLEPIVYKLTHPEAGDQGMTLTEADTAVQFYRASRALIKLHPGEQIAPTKAIDQVWHAHILDTEKYAGDCDAVFGRLIHHYPYFGMRGRRDAAALAEAAARTRRLIAGQLVMSPAILAALSGADHCIIGPGKCHAPGTKPPQPANPPKPGKALERPRPDRRPLAAV
jgi:hypothetical protein